MTECARCDYCGARLTRHSVVALWEAIGGTPDCPAAPKVPHGRPVHTAVPLDNEA